MKVLVVVDFCNDFCEVDGSMYVKGSKEAYEAILKALNSQEFDYVLFTLDWHPLNHCSFKINGGLWPVHSVQYSVGAAFPLIFQELVRKYNIESEVILKGTDPDIEEYGAFNGVHKLDDHIFIPYSEETLLPLPADAKFVVCGLAGDYCVKATIINLLTVTNNVEVFVDGIASIDGGKELNRFIAYNSLEVWSVS